MQKTWITRKSWVTLLGTPHRRARGEKWTGNLLLVFIKVARMTLVSHFLHYSCALVPGSLAMHTELAHYGIDEVRSALGGRLPKGGLSCSAIACGRLFNPTPVWTGLSERPTLPRKNVGSKMEKQPLGDFDWLRSKCHFLGGCEFRWCSFGGTSQPKWHGNHRLQHGESWIKNTAAV